MPDEADLAQEHIEQEAAMRERERNWYANTTDRPGQGGISSLGFCQCGETVDPRRLALGLYTCIDCASAAERQRSLLQRRFR